LLPDDLLLDRLRMASAARRDELVELTQALVCERSLLGHEEGGQRVIADHLSGLGFQVQRVEIDPPANDSDRTWGYPPLPYSGRTCVAARIDGTGSGRSLHLSGHIDVVPVESAEQWDHDPWAGEVSDGRVWGRGAGDMKAGLAAYMVGVAAFLEVYGEPAGDLLFSSVIEEECTGNGMKAVLAAGYDADGTLIGEPSELQLMHAGVGVIWARLTARSGGAHPGFSTGGSSSMAILRALDGLRELERSINERPGVSEKAGHAGGAQVFFAAHEHPFRLNVGRLSGGVWPSSEPAQAEARIRLGFGMELTPTDAQRLVAEAVRTAAPEVDVVFEGFRAHAYSDDLGHTLAAALSDSHELLHGSPPRPQVLPATTDARSVTGPCVCYGPVAGAIHGTDEWVDIASTEAVATAIAITIACWQKGGLAPKPTDSAVVSRPGSTSPRTSA
jgi:acetylornithine deacetylase